jgi:hypothetical protein
MFWRGWYFFRSSSPSSSCWAMESSQGVRQANKPKPSGHASTTTTLQCVSKRFWMPGTRMNDELAAWPLSRVSGGWPGEFFASLHSPQPGSSPKSALFKPIRRRNDHELVEPLVGWKETALAQAHVGAPAHHLS